MLITFTCYYIHVVSLELRFVKYIFDTNKHGDSKSDVLLCFDTKFKS